MNTDNLQQLLDVEDIKKLRIKYTHLLDANRIEEASLLFATDAICQTDREPWNGRTAIKEGLQKAFNDYDVHHKGRYPFLHVISNQWIEIIDDITAKGSCYLTDNITGRKSHESTLLLLGVYHDEYTKINGQWFIKSSSLDIVWS